MSTHVTAYRCLLHACMFVFMYVYVCMFVFMHVSMHACLYSCMCTCIYVYTYVCICDLCMYVRMQHACAYIYMYVTPHNTQRKKTPAKRKKKNRITPQRADRHRTHTTTCTRACTHSLHQRAYTNTHSHSRTHTMPTCTLPSLLWLPLTLAVLRPWPDATQSFRTASLLVPDDFIAVLQP